MWQSNFFSIGVNDVVIVYGFVDVMVMLVELDELQCDFGFEILWEMIFSVGLQNFSILLFGVRM